MLGLSRWFHGRVVYPGVVWARGEGQLFQRLAELRALERRPSDELARRQDARLAALLNYAAERSPYYHARWPKGGAVAAHDARRRLADLPFLAKADLQAGCDELRAQPKPSGRVTRKTTGGSTGQPVTVLKDRLATAYERAAMWLGYGWFGVRVGDRVARFWGSPLAFRQRVGAAAADWAMHRIRFSAFAFTDDDLERHWARCRSFRPDYLHGYVSMLEAFADFLSRRGYDARDLGLKSIIATSEVVSLPQRTRIQECFRAPVQIEYGCGETGPIAYECEQGSLHLMMDDLVVEILTPEGRPAGLGESGEVVLTDLNNRAMPLVRYRLGDFAVVGTPCGCGRGFPVLDSVWGRAYDFVETADGRRYHGEFFMYVFEDLRREGGAVRQFQITQRTPSLLDVAVVAEADDGGKLEQRIRTLLQHRLPGMQVSISRVAEIQRSHSGKMQVIRRAEQLTGAGEPPGFRGVGTGVAP
jgi:phenylacetate-coenzyme A ligase PaaK-like adenylate-forming protein